MLSAAGSALRLCSASVEGTLDHHRHASSISNTILHRALGVGSVWLSDAAEQLVGEHEPIGPGRNLPHGPARWPVPVRGPIPSLFAAARNRQVETAWDRTIGLR